MELPDGYRVTDRGDHVDALFEMRGNDYATLEALLERSGISETPPGKDIRIRFCGGVTTSNDSRLAFIGFALSDYRRNGRCRVYLDLDARGTDHLRRVFAGRNVAHERGKGWRLDI